MFGLKEVTREYKDEEVIANVGFEYLINTLITSNVVVEDPYRRQLALMELHDRSYDIYNYSNPNDDDPNEIGKSHISLKPIDMKEAYNLYGDGSLVEYFIREYVLLDINKYLGMSLMEWLSLDRIHQSICKKSIEYKKNLEIEANRETIKEIKMTEKNK